MKVKTQNGDDTQIQSSSSIL